MNQTFSVRCNLDVLLSRLCVSYTKCVVSGLRVADTTIIRNANVEILICIQGAEDLIKFKKNCCSLYLEGGGEAYPRIQLVSRLNHKIFCIWGALDKNKLYPGSEI